MKLTRLVAARYFIYATYLPLIERITVSASSPGLLVPRLADNGLIGRLVPYLSTSSPGVFSFYIIIYIIFVPVKCELSESWERKTTPCELRNLMSNDSPRLNNYSKPGGGGGGASGRDALLLFFFFEFTPLPSSNKNNNASMLLY